MIVSDLTQVLPDDGTEPSEPTQVCVVYDGSALYIGARLYESDPTGIARRLGRRDSDTSSDAFSVAIDSYHDHRTAFRFSVNPAGVRSDEVTTSDDSYGDESWEPVWDVATRVDSLGWVVEMRIPFSQLRFSSADEQVWGINFSRGIFRKHETVRWSWVPNTEQGYASHFGHLLGLRDIPPPRRLEILPYTVGKADYQGGTRGNPFTEGGIYNAAMGLDLKYGLTSNLTLDATINPDFGQVEADPAVVNLSAFEIYFSERRPFFVEGADIFRFGAGSGGFVFGAPTLFYSEAVGEDGWMVRRSSGCPHGTRACRGPARRRHSDLRAGRTARELHGREPEKRLPRRRQRHRRPRNERHPRPVRPGLRLPHLVRLRGWRGLLPQVRREPLRGKRLVRGLAHPG
jgi:hypothetical protein